MRRIPLLIAVLFWAAFSFAQSSGGNHSSGGAGTPCTTTALSLQYNNAGSFGCLPNVTYNSTTGQFTASQKADTNETFYGKRFTDTTPTGNFFHFQNAAANADIFKLDVNGNATFAGTATVGSLITGGTGADTYTGLADPACSTSFLLWASTTTPNTYKYCDANSNIRIFADTTSTQTFTGKSIAASEINSGTLAVAQGGTNLASGTSGGILCYTAAGTLASSGALTANVLAKGGGAGVCPTNSLHTDDGTTDTYTGTGGLSAPKVAATGSGAGAIQMTASTAQGHATANTVTIEAPAAVTAYEDVWPGTSASGFIYGTNSAAVRTESFGELSGDVTTSGSLATTVAKVNGVGIQRVTMVADWTCGNSGTSTTCTAATIVGTNGTPLTITLPNVAASYHWQCEGVVGQATAATANSWNFLTATNGATNVTASYSMNTAATAMTGGATTDQASTTTTVVIGPTWTLGGTATKMPFRVSASIEGASASGTVLSLQLVAPTTADVVTIYRGATCSVAPF